MSTIHGKSHAAIRFFRQCSASLEVYWIYISRTNYENVAWPSSKGLAKGTDFNKNTVLKARRWLVEHGALERVKDYTRPEWRGLPEKERKVKLALDHNEYYRPTGKLKVSETEYVLLYFPQSEPSDIESDDGLPGQPTTVSTDDAASPELDSTLTDTNVSVAQSEPVKENPEASAPDTPSTGKPKRTTIPAAQMNPMKDAIVASFKWSWDAITKSAIGEIQQAAHELCEKGYKPEDIPKIYAYCCEQKWSHFGPMALAKHAAAWKAKSNVRAPSWRDGIIAIDGVPL